MSSKWDPTRVVRRLGGAGGFELTDTSGANVSRFDAAGRLVEQKKRTGETDFTVVYADAQSDRIDRIVNPVGGAWVFAYAGGKLASITDPAGGMSSNDGRRSWGSDGLSAPDGEHHGSSTISTAWSRRRARAGT